MNTIYSVICDKKKENKKQFAVLVDPDKICASQDGARLGQLAEKAGVDYIFVGGSLLTRDNLTTCIQALKDHCSAPVVLFPGNILQIDSKADGIFFLSLISSRNPEMLIGRHVISAPYLKSSNLEIIPTGYMLIDSGKPTAVSYMSNSTPIPHDKNEIALCTAMAGEMLGLKLIYMDGGSGALNPISDSMIRAVAGNVSVPVIVGGGINTPEMAITKCIAGADVIVAGNSIEKNPNLILSLSEAIHSL